MASGFPSLSNCSGARWALASTKTGRRSNSRYRDSQLIPPRPTPRPAERESESSSAAAAARAIAGSLRTMGGAAAPQ
eukprot:scaffold105392_cov30-Tisochrysis_lutea.AAC.1